MNTIGAGGAARPFSPTIRRLAEALRDLARAEMSRLRSDAGQAPDVRCPAGPAVAISLGAGGLEADSLERSWLTLAAHDFLALDGTAWDTCLGNADTIRTWAETGVDRLRSGPNPAVVFRSSGTTGAAKPVRQPLATLMEEVETLAGLFEGRQRVIRLAPAHHIYGFLFTVLLPDRLGIDVVDETLTGLPFRLRPGDLLVGHPLLWHQAAHFWRAIPEEIWAINSTGPCPPEVLERLRSLGAARVLEVYGATETGGIGWRDDPRGPYVLMKHLDPTPDGGIRRGAEPLSIQDHLAWDGARTFRVAGRCDGALRIGGHSVHAEAVADHLHALPGVVFAEVTPFKTPGGLRLSARVRLAQSQARATLDAAIQALPAAQRPVTLIIDDDSQ